MTESISPELHEGAFKLGSDLATPGQDIPQAVDQLNLNLATIGCEPSVGAEHIRGSCYTPAFEIASPPFKRAVRGSTASIILREESLADSMPPPGSTLLKESDGVNASAAWVPPESFDQEQVLQALKNSTEGAIWVDPDEAQYRANIAKRNAALLKAVIGGLAAKGYPEPNSKSDMRAEFNEMLDGLWSRGSYHCFATSKVVASIRQRAGLRTASDSILAARRFKKFGKDYGYGLAMYRLLPESVLAELG